MSQAVPPSPLPPRHDSGLIMRELEQLGSISEVINVLFAEHYGFGYVEAEFAEVLFDPSLRDLAKLPPAILDAKDLLLPKEFVPSSEPDLLRFTRRLLICSTRSSSQDILVEGWPYGNSRPTMDDHVSRLWKVRNEYPDVFSWLVGGRFKPVIHLIRGLRPNLPAKADLLTQLLTVQALIWSAHDVQMVFARIAQDMVLGTIVGSTKNKSPEAAMNALRDNFAAVELILDIYFQRSDWRAGALPTSPVPAQGEDLKRHAHDRVRKIAKQIGPIVHNFTAAKVHGLICDVARQMRAQEGFLQRAAMPRSANSEAKQWAQEYYGLPRFAAAYVPILRLVQAEQLLPALIKKLTTLPESALSDAAPSLPVWADPKGARNSVARVDELFLVFREAFLPSGGPSDENASRSARKKAQDFLLKDPAKTVLKNGDPSRIARTLQLLDVNVAHRFTGKRCEYRP